MSQEKYLSKENCELCGKSFTKRAIENKEYKQTENDNVW